MGRRDQRHLRSRHPQRGDRPAHPIIAVPDAKAALAAHPAFGHSLKTLAECGVTLLANEAIRTAPAPGGEPVYGWTPVISAVRTMDDEPRPAP